jgi:hypothetical protein
MSHPGSRSQTPIRGSTTNNKHQHQPHRVKVFVRVNSSQYGENGETDSLCAAANEPVVTTKQNSCEVRVAGRGRFPFSFDGCFGLGKDQEGVYATVGKPVLEHVLSGYNACILSYGATGSGKTYSMFGPPGALGTELMGIVPRLCNELFDYTAARRGGVAYSSSLSHCVTFSSITMSMVEVYMEDVFDLLHERKELKVKFGEGGTSSFEVPDAFRPRVSSYQDVIDLLHISERNKTVASTSIHERSSRAHTLCQLTVSLTRPDGSIQTSRIALGDLAGSERVKAAGTDGGVPLNEACNINLSLLTLGRCIEAVVSRKATIGEFRNSTLTKLLKDYIGGNSVTAMLVTVSPKLSEANNTIQTLRFADRARRLQNRARENVWAKGKDGGEVDVAKGRIATKTAADVFPVNDELLRRQELLAQEIECERHLESAQLEVLEAETAYSENDASNNDYFIMLDVVISNRERCEELLESVRRQAYPREYALRDALEQSRQAVDTLRDQVEMQEATSVMYHSAEGQLRDVSQRNCELEDEVDRLRRKCTFLEDEMHRLRNEMEAKTERLEGEKSQLVLNTRLLVENALQQADRASAERQNNFHSRALHEGTHRLLELVSSTGDMYKEFIDLSASAFARSAVEHCTALSKRKLDMAEASHQTTLSRVTSRHSEEMQELVEECSALHSIAWKVKTRAEAFTRRPDTTNVKHGLSECENPNLVLSLSSLHKTKSNPIPHDDWNMAGNYN